MLFGKCQARKTVCAYASDGAGGSPLRCFRLWQMAMPSMAYSSENSAI